MWAVLATAVLAALRRRLRVPPRVWRRVHIALAVAIVAGTVVHAALIEGTMGTVSKTALSALAVAATAAAILRTSARIRDWTRIGQRRQGSSRQS